MLVFCFYLKNEVINKSGRLPKNILKRRPLCQCPLGGFFWRAFSKTPQTLRKCFLRCARAPSKPAEARQENRFFGEPNKVFGEPNKVFGEPNKVFGEPNKFFGEPNKFFGEPNKVFGEPNKVFGEPNKFFGEPNKVFWGTK
jgi:hypothetical protein